TVFRFCAVLSLSVLLAGAVSAQNLPESCDSDFYDVMEARGTMEAVREMEIAQALILKPDSVMEYSCFSDTAGAVQSWADGVFSDAIFSSEMFQDPPEMFTPADDATSSFPQFLPTIDDTAVTPFHYGGQDTVIFGPNPPPGLPEIFGSGRLDMAMGNLVFQSLDSFHFDNFFHAYAGGAFFPRPGSVVPNVCNPMDLVWEFFKCQNFNAAFHDAHFIRLEDFPSFDPRFRPLNIACSDPNRNATLQAVLAASKTAPGGAGGVEAVVTYMDLMDSASCSSLDPVFTGIKVFRNSPLGMISYEDAVCPAAGCYFDPAAGGSGACF
ncbi:MAG: hypothetical protein ACRBCT_09280, partial [Alphaproteobacteria bacterium]